MHEAKTRMSPFSPRTDRPALGARKVPEESGEETWARVAQEKTRAEAKGATEISKLSPELAELARLAASARV